MSDRVLRCKLRADRSSEVNIAAGAADPTTDSTTLTFAARMWGKIAVTAELTMRCSE